jgi:hypothetical protein
MTNCHKREKYGKGLFIKFEEATNNTTVDFEQEPGFDGKEEVDEEIAVGVLADEDPLLVVKSMLYIS